ncbi:hypothetical protein FXB40_36595 [Bradyrhizobium rifense]|uniref:DUF6894 domain-containing protein n=1 Tax=Bradyrhizobium rifense TaxID=515499 RepID=A0A5D3K1N2_9BRAD|nr:hypothetical protein [Bradyrhizobium rifense]TYL89117.1 hypothetical protein FXB40_36595 [Bradyrhizobium rifense]
MRYYFDIRDDFLAVSDGEGAEYASVEAARKEAIVTVTSIARDVFTSRGSQVTVTVRSEDGPLFEMTVTLGRKEFG